MINKLLLLSLIHLYLLLLSFFCFHVSLLCFMWKSSWTHEVNLWSEIFSELGARQLFTLTSRFSFLWRIILKKCFCFFQPNRIWDLPTCRASRRLAPALRPRRDDLWAGCLWFCSRWAIWMRMRPIEWRRQKGRGTKEPRSWIWTKDKLRDEWKEEQGGRPQWNNPPSNGFDILYMPADSKHCVIIYKWAPPSRKTLQVSSPPLSCKHNK